MTIKISSFHLCVNWPRGKNWSGEWPISFSFPPLECWRSNQVALQSY